MLFVTGYVQQKLHPTIWVRTKYDIWSKTPNDPQNTQQWLEALESFRDLIAENFLTIPTAMAPRGVDRCRNVEVVVTDDSRIKHDFPFEE